MSRRQNWVKVPRESAAPWAKLGCYEQFVGLQLLIQLDCHDGSVEGELASAIEQCMRGTVGNANERRRFRAAAACLQAEGLLFEHEGRIYLLYGRDAWLAHRALAAELLAARQPVAAPAPKPAKQQAATVTKLARRPANDNARPCAHRVATVSPPCRQTELSIENHSIPITRERERDLKSATRSGDAQPAAAPPVAPAMPLKKARRTRRLTPLDLARAQVLDVFNRHYAPRHDGVRSWASPGLLTVLAQAYSDADGKLRTELFERVVLAFLDDPRWAVAGERGHGLGILAYQHDRYLASKPALAPERTTYVGF